MFHKNTRHKLHLNILQLLKFGLLVGPASKYVNSFSRPFLIGQKSGVAFVDAQTALSHTRRVVFLIRKIFLKKEKVFIANQRALMPFWYPSLRLKGGNKNGFLTNREFTRKKLGSSYKSDFLSSRIRGGFLRQRAYAEVDAKLPLRRGPFFRAKLPALCLLDGLESNDYLVLDSRKKNMLSVLFNDATHRNNVSHYCIVANNASTSSAVYFNRLVRWALARP